MASTSWQLPRSRPSRGYGYRTAQHRAIFLIAVATASIAYLIAMLGLGLHLNHGVWSLFSSLGVSHPRYSNALRRVASLVATLLVLGNVSIPLAVLTGLIGK